MNRTLTASLMVAMLSLGFHALAYAQDADVDWKYIGNTDTDTIFYDAKGIQRLPDGHIKVWSKTISDKSLDAYFAKTPINKTLVKAVAERIKSGYLPPVFKIITSPKLELVSVISHEYYANFVNSTPTGRIFWELDCKNQQTRFLSISFLKKGRWLSGPSEPEHWQPAAPETNSAHILKVLCQ